MPTVSVPTKPITDKEVRDLFKVKSTDKLLIEVYRTLLGALRGNVKLSTDKATAIKLILGYHVGNPATMDVPERTPLTQVKVHFDLVNALQPPLETISLEAVMPSNDLLEEGGE